MTRCSAVLQRPVVVLATTVVVLATTVVVLATRWPGLRAGRLPKAETSGEANTTRTDTIRISRLGAAKPAQPLNVQQAKHGIL